MKKYIVQAREVLHYDIPVEAENIDEATELAINMIITDDMIIDSEDFEIGEIMEVQND